MVDSILFRIRAIEVSLDRVDEILSRYERREKLPQFDEVEEFEY